MKIVLIGEYRLIIMEWLKSFKMKNQKKQRNENWDDEGRPKENKWKKLGYGVYNDMHDKKPKPIKKKPKYKNDWLNLDEDEWEGYNQK